MVQHLDHDDVHEGRAHHTRPVQRKIREVLVMQPLREGERASHDARARARFRHQDNNLETTLDKLEDTDTTIRQQLPDLLSQRPLPPLVAVSTATALSVTESIPLQKGEQAGAPIEATASAKKALLEKTAKRGCERRPDCLQRLETKGVGDEVDVVVEEDEAARDHLAVI
eukprot:3883053-Pleurochrysis_carterae.AAC.1